MKVSEVIGLCSEMADLALPQRYAYDNGKEALQDQRVQRLIGCCNSVLEVLYCDYATAIARCSVTAKNNFVDVTNLALNRVLSLTDANGNNVKYRYTSGGLFVENGSYVLTYAKLPPKILWDDEIVLPSPRITERIFAYGVVADYFLAVGDFDVANVWEARFRDALHSASLKTSHKSMPVGRWV